MFVEMEIVGKKKASCRRLPQNEDFRNQKKDSSDQTVLLSIFSKTWVLELAMLTWKNAQQDGLTYFFRFRKSSFWGA